MKGDMTVTNFVWSERRTGILSDVREDRDVILSPVRGTEKRIHLGRRKVFKSNVLTGGGRVIWRVQVEETRKEDL